MGLLACTATEGRLWLFAFRTAARRSCSVAWASWIGLSDGDCAPSPSHTTGRAVFRIRRLNAAGFTFPQDLMVGESPAGAEPR